MFAVCKKHAFPDRTNFVKKGYTFYWSGRNPKERREAGVAFAIANNIAKYLVCFPQAISDRLIKLRLPLNDNRHLTIICCYALTMMHTDDSKEIFYEALKTSVRQVPCEDKLMILRDFNARVGSDGMSWPTVLGHHGKGAWNSNGELLQSFCAEQQMTVSNKLFQMPDKWFYSWKHPPSKRYHLLDYVLVRQSNTQDITSTRIMRGEDCSTDNFLVRTICKFHIKLIRRRTKASVPKRVNVRSPVDDFEVQTKFQKALASKMNSLDQSSETSINEQWQSISAATHAVMLENLEPPTRRNTDWFDENNESIQPFLDERTTARNEMLNTGLRSKTAKFKECKRKVQSSLRQMKDDWWNKKAEAVQELDTDMDIPPSLEEIEDAVNSLKNGKDPGADGIPSELHKMLFKLCTLSSRPAGMKLNYPKTSKMLRLSLSPRGETALSVGTIVESHCYQLLAKFLPRSYCPDYNKLQIRYFLKASVVSEPTDLQLMQSSLSVSYRKN